MFHHRQYSDKDDASFYTGARSDLHEQVANKFAGFFLMPRHLAEEYIEEHDHKVDMFEMKHHFKVSIQSLYYVLNEYKMISKAGYREFWKTLNGQGLKRKEPEPMETIFIQDKNKRLMKHLKRLYLEDEVSVNKISEVLGLKLVDTRRLLKDWRDVDERFVSLK